MTFHYCLCYMSLHIQTPYTFDKLRINCIHYEMSHKPSIMIRHSQGGWLNAELAIHFRCGSFYSLPTNNRRDGNYFLSLTPTPLPVGKNLQNWLNAHPRIRRANDNCIGKPDRLTRPASWFRLFDAVKPESFYARLTFAMDKIFLKRQFTFVCFNECSHGPVRHRQDSMLYSPCLAEISCDLA